VKPKWNLLTTLVAIIVVIFTVLRFFNSVSQRSTIDVATYVLFVVGGLILAAAPFDRKRTRSGWARGLFACVAALLVFVGVSELLRHYRLWVLSPQVEHGFSYTLILFRGVVLGFLLALVVSGELAGRKIPSHANA
jgi:peptidoglycan/LPS O-acetylase OafA/YrhL